MCHIQSIGSVANYLVQELSALLILILVSVQCETCLYNNFPLFLDIFMKFHRYIRLRKTIYRASPTTVV